jgi:hypothetical protein
LLSQCPVQIQLKIFHTIIKLEKSPYFCDAETKKISNGQRLEGYWKNIGDDYEEKQNDLSTAEKGTIRKRPKMIKGRETQMRKRRKCTRKSETCPLAILVTQMRKEQSKDQ